MIPLTPEEKARREKLYGAVGRAVFTCQMLESQLGIVLAILNDKLTLHMDLTQLVVPDDRRTLGQLIQALGTLSAAPPEAEAVLASALAARNRIVHHFFVRNIDAFEHENVFVEAVAALESETRLLSACLIDQHPRRHFWHSVAEPAKHLLARE
jgi:hypothetical protein